MATTARQRKTNYNFTKQQLAKLKRSFAGIKRMNPESKQAKDIKKLIKGMGNKDLEKVKDAKIPFLSAEAIMEILTRERKKSR